MSISLKLLTDPLDRQMKPLGFRRSGLRWNRDVGMFVDVVTLQRTKSLDAVYVNLGVQDPGVFTRWWRKPPASVLDEADCTVRARLGVLIDGRDRVWDPHDPGAAEDLWRQLVEHGLPFLESMHARSSMVEYLGPWSRQWPSAIYLALLKAELQDFRGACDILNAYQASRDVRLGAWPRLEELMVELRCKEAGDVDA